MYNSSAGTLVPLEEAGFLGDPTGGPGDEAVNPRWRPGARSAAVHEGQNGDYRRFDMSLCDGSVKMFVTKLPTSKKSMSQKFLTEFVSAN